MFIIDYQRRASIQQERKRMSPREQLQAIVTLKEAGKTVDEVFT